MPFNSLSYLLFLPAVWLVYILVWDRARWFVLLMSSVFFYAALKVPYLVVVLGLVTLFTYAVGICLADCTEERTKRILLWGGILGNLVALGALKYLPIILTNLYSPFGSSFFFAKGFVTIGVSYFTFQAISYLTDIYLGLEERPERHLGYFAVYLSFFPKLLQGPIERAGDLLPQLRQPYRFDYENVRAGAFMFGWGLFKKVVVADRLALFVNPVYNSVQGNSGLVLALATYLYALQIYFDFSGYTDMALGAARLFNINLTQNFNRPYLATSVADFWRRWHVSFSRWILDYIFKPLQMRWRNLKTWGTAASLLVAFMVSGVWHGASWGFLIWGFLHGVYLASSVLYKPLQKKLHKKLGVEKTNVLKVWQTLVTFNLICFAWIFFRANTLQDAWYVVTHLMSGTKGGYIYLMSQGKPDILILLSMLAIFSLGDRLKLDCNSVLARPDFYRWSFYLALSLGLIMLGVFTNSSFIYYKF